MGQLLYCLLLSLLLLLCLPAVIFAKFVNVLLMEFEHLLCTRVFAFVILCDLSRACSRLCKDLLYVCVCEYMGLVSVTILRNCWQATRHEKTQRQRQGERTF